MPTQVRPTQILRILALDLGTRMGWALAEDGRLAAHGVVDFSPGRFEGAGMRYLRFRSFLDGQLDRLGGIDALFFEDVRGHKGTDAAHVYAAFLGNLGSWAEERGVPHAGLPPATIKRQVAGSGNAAKDAMIRAARRWAPGVADDNEADAVCIVTSSPA
jgi:hypothetical protein